MLCTFGHDEVGKGWHHSASAINYVLDRPGRSMMSMNACLRTKHY